MKTKNKKVMITVVFPITFDLLSFARLNEEGKITKILEKALERSPLTYEEKQTVKDYAIQIASLIYDSSSIEARIQDCDIKELIDSY